ncbi:MAG: peptidylprolyl isomerase [Rickettsiales bacterium]
MFKKILFSLLFISLSQYSLADEPAKKAEDKIVAKVNGNPIYESEIRNKIKSFLEFNGLSNNPKFDFDNLNTEMKNDIIKNIILGDLVLKEAKANKVEDDSDFKGALEFTKSQLTQKFYLEKVIKENVTEAKLQEEYKKLSSEMSTKDEYKVAQILVSSEEEAKTIKSKLDKGEDFMKLAKEVSQDPSKDAGIELDYFTTGQMVPAFESATEKLKIGEISAPIKTDFGYHIIKLIDKRKMKVPSFEEVKEKIYEDISTNFVQEYIKNLQEKNKVELL